jgi:hypothetical protein
MKTSNDRTEAAEKRAKKEYKKPVFNTFGRVAELTTGGSSAKMESHPNKPGTMP